MRATTFGKSMLRSGRKVLVRFAEWRVNKALQTGGNRAKLTKAKEDAWVILAALPDLHRKRLSRWVTKSSLEREPALVRVSAVYIVR